MSTVDGGKNAPAGQAVTMKGMTMETILRHQNTMLALRQQMGWPLIKPANDCIAFTSGRPTDYEVGMEIGRIATMLGKDLIYSGWSSVRAKEPTGFTIAYREMLSVDIVDRVVPYAANDDAPVVLVSTRGDEFFAIDPRGSLVRVDGKPKRLGEGRKRAMRRIKAAAATMRDDLLPGNRRMLWGAETIEPDTSAVETIVRFG